MKKVKWIYRGLKVDEHRKFSREGIPKGTVFTTDPIMANKHGKLIAIPFSSTTKPTKDNSIFQRLKLKERYFTTVRKRKKFVNIVVLS